MSSAANILLIHTDSNFNIIHINGFACELLGYESKEILGQAFTIILPKLQKNPSVTCEAMNNVANDRKHFVLMTKKKKAINCFGKIDILTDGRAYMEFRLVTHIDSPLVPNDYMKYINNQVSFHVNIYSNVCCLMFDMANSTQYWNRSSTIEVAYLFHKMYKVIDEIVTKDFFPCVHIHETCGDNFFVLVNMFGNCTQTCATLSLEAASKILININKLLETIDDSLYMRCGTSFGEISAGVIDGRSFRAFGSIIHMASRLESVCEKNHVAFDEKFLHKLENESSYHTKNGYDYVSIHELKGFGDTQMFSKRIIKI